MPESLTVNYPCENEGELRIRYMSKSTVTLQKSNLTTIVLSFIGTLAALPIALMVYGAPDKAAATNYQAAPTDNYAQYAHAYTQGYLAQTAASSATAGTDTAHCGEVLGASTTQHGASAQSVAAQAHVAPAPASHKTSGMMSKDKMVQSIHNSYNSYSQAVVNNNYKNSHNVVGSNNTTKTEVNVKDSQGAVVHTNNMSTTVNTSVTDSFNKDSYNTEHKTTVINDSFNKTNNIAVVKDSYNTEATTNTTTVNTTTENVGNTDNSGQNNSVNTDKSVTIKDNNVSL